MLDEMASELDPYRATIEGNVHYYMTMASILELEKVLIQKIVR